MKSILKSENENRHHNFGRVHFAGTASEQAEDRAGFTDRFGRPQNFRSRFLQIAVNLSPLCDGDRVCGVTQRWFYPQFEREARDPDGNLRGRKERGAEGVAGLAGAYRPPDEPTETGGNTSFLSRACSNGNSIAGIYREIAKELEKIVDSGAVPAGGIAVAALGIGAGAAIALAAAVLCAALLAAAVLLKALADEIEFGGEQSFAATINASAKGILDHPLIPHDIGIMIVRAIFNEAFKMQQGKRDYVALSYAVMDGHDYLDKSCYGNAESIEVFFDANRPDLYCAYVDEVVSFEAFQQEQRHNVSVGYVSLRYVLGSRGLISPSRFDETVVIEVAALRDASGSVDFVYERRPGCPEPDL